jgi:predicted transcriptional regulator
MASLGQFQRRNRGTIEMMASILEVCLEGTKKTHILYRANISSDPLNEYLELLVKSGMLEKSELYRTTVKGRIYLEHFKGILHLLGKSDPERS